jgi:DNA-directed RNA polymerase subunit beta'
VKSKRIRYKGIIATVVVLKLKNLRRDRVGHINLVVPIAHIWYFRSLPNKIGYILGLPSKIRYDCYLPPERYVVIQAEYAKNTDD